MNNEICEYLMKMRESLEYNKYFFDETDKNNEKIIVIINKLLKELDQRLKSECSHDYVNDYIDTDCDTSQQICYCNKCMCSFPTK